jgi:chromosomal replication initiation ATPase DnaA
MNELVTGQTKSPETAQLPLPLPQLPPCYDREAFLIAPSNESAWRAAEAWLASDDPSLIICGPSGAGKTHLAAIIAEGRGVFTDWRAPATQSEYDIVVFDDLPPSDPRAFMTTVEDLASSGKRSVLVGRDNPGDWSQDLKDLRTRLEAIPRAVMSEPDEALLRAVMSKAFSDRQINVGHAVIEYAAPRLPRLFAAVHGFVALADEIAARRKRPVTISLAREILNSLCEPAPA